MDDEAEMDDGPEDFPAYLASLKPEDFPPFEPRPRYNREGDLIEVFFEDATCYARSLPHGLTVFYEMVTHRVVGVQVVAIRRLMAEGMLPATACGD